MRIKIKQIVMFILVNTILITALVAASAAALVSVQSNNIVRVSVASDGIERKRR